MFKFFSLPEILLFGIWPFFKILKEYDFDLDIIGIKLDCLPDPISSIGNN